MERNTLGSLLAVLVIFHNITFPSFVASAPSCERLSTLLLTDIPPIAGSSFFLHPLSALEKYLLHVYYLFSYTLLGRYAKAASMLTQLNNVFNITLHLLLCSVEMWTRFQLDPSRMDGLVWLAPANANIDSQQR